MVTKKDLMQVSLDWYSDMWECSKKCHWIFVYERMRTLKKYVLKNIELLTKEKQIDVKNYFKDHPLNKFLNKTI